MDEKIRYPEESPALVKTWAVGDLQLSIIGPPGFRHHCGYVRFPSRPVRETSYHGILTYVPVHGGITYAKEDPTDGSMVYGFDCAHAGDEERPELHDLEWLGAETHRMAKAIQLAAEFEERFLLAQGDTEAAAVLDAYHAAVREATGQKFNLADNFGAMIAVLGGDLK